MLTRGARGPPAPPPRPPLLCSARSQVVGSRAVTLLHLRARAPAPGGTALALAARAPAPVWCRFPQKCSGPRTFLRHEKSLLCSGRNACLLFCCHFLLNKVQPSLQKQSFSFCRGNGPSPPPRCPMQSPFLAVLRSPPGTLSFLFFPINFLSHYDFNPPTSRKDLRPFKIKDM